MTFHMTEHVFVSIFLCQQLLQMNFNMREASISISRCHVTWSLPGQCMVFPDLPQLYKCMLILQLFIVFLQIMYNPLRSLQLHGQSINLSLLFLDDLFEL